MNNIREDITEAFEGTDFFVLATSSNDETIQKLPDIHCDPMSIYLVVSSIQIRKACLGIIIYRIDLDLKVTVYNTHKLRVGSYARIRDFKYEGGKALLEDAYSAQRSLVNLPA
jgi:hypothetical protein